MISEIQFQNELQILIANAIREDVGPGDYSSLACIPETATGKAKLLVKEDGIIAGVVLAKMIFEYVDPSLQMETFIELNTMQRMSAIATKTQQYVKLLKGTKTQLLDTRKTTPGFRAAEKWAVKIGGGVNHRFALYDMIMLKDNHNDFAGGITLAIAKTKAFLKKNKLDLKIIVEARNLDEIKEILKSEDIHRILIDNFNYQDTKTAVALIGDKCQTESSGNINEDTIRLYAECGVNYISSGALTHSIYNIDLSLKAL
jgi:nicotinate-nucleotide pyrophosphorylase (carboxylating)